MVSGDSGPSRRALDTLQYQAKALDRILSSMADVVDMTDELVAAAKKTDDATADLMSRLHREARAYKALQPILNAAVRESGDVKEQLASFLESSPRLARYLARWQSEGAAPSA